MISFCYQHSNISHHVNLTHASLRDCMSSRDSRSIPQASRHCEVSNLAQAHYPQSIASSQHCMHVIPCIYHQTIAEGYGLHSHLHLSTIASNPAKKHRPSHHGRCRNACMLLQSCHLLQDIQLMKTLGIKAFRMSISWPRIQPTGTGLPNQAGLGFYNSVIDRLLAAGIEPWITLYHWDLPQVCL